MPDPIYFVVWFYNQRGGAENLIKEANNDAGPSALARIDHPLLSKTDPGILN
jgi:hypothetical protein